MAVPGVRLLWASMNFIQGKQEARSCEGKAVWFFTSESTCLNISKTEDRLARKTCDWEEYFCVLSYESCNMRPDGL